MQKLMKKSFFYCSFLLSFILFVSLAFQQDLIQIIGYPWTPGFFEIASDINANDEWIYLSDMNNSKIQVYSKDLMPLFHFGGYGLDPGNFIEIRGLCATPQKLFVASIDALAQKTGRIQAFSRRGIYEFEFDKPKQRSDFISIAALKNNNIAAITERSLCIYNADGKIQNEVQSITGHSFLFLQDIVSVPDKGMALIDRAKRGFFIIDPELKNIQHFGEEYVNIPTAIDFFDKRFIVADANGDLILFQQNGRYIKTIATGIYSNGIQSISSNRLLMTSALRRGIAQIDLNTGKIQEIFFEPKNNLELHWPESIAINNQKHLYVSDDYLGGMKIISLENNSYIGQSGFVSDPPQGLKIVSIAASSGYPNAYALSRTNLSSIYVFREAQLLRIISRSEKDYFCHLECDSKGFIYALNCTEKSIVQFDEEGNVVNDIILPARDHEVVTFTASENIYVLLSNGELIFFPNHRPDQMKTLQLENMDGFLFNQVSSIIYQEKSIILCFRHNHCLVVYDLESGEVTDIFGSSGGPKTYPSKENLQVDIGYQPGFFLFPSKLLKHEGSIAVSDAGNHRVQIIPLSLLASKSTLIVLRIGSKKALVDHIELELDVAPFILQQRTMVPLRFVGEAFEAKVDWIAEERKIIITLDDVKIELWIQQNRALINQEPFYSDVPPIIVQQRTFVPVRFISEAFNAQVEWEAKNQIITIRRKKESL